MQDGKTYFVDGREYYSADDAPVWPQRHRELVGSRPLAAEKSILGMLSRIDELEQRTRPSAGDASAVGKDAAAFQALSLAARLVEHIAGWAIDHQRGMAEKALRFVPRGHSSPTYHEARAAVDQHEHERAGASVEKFDPPAARRFVSNMVLAMGSGLRLPNELTEALEALDYGEVLPILQKVRTTKRTGLVEYRAKLTAVAYIEYQYKKGVLKRLSIEVVAEKFKTVAIDSVKDWPVEVRAALGNLAVERAIAFARNAGASYRRPDFADLREGFEQRFGEPALDEAARRYRAR